MTRVLLTNVLGEVIDMKSLPMLEYGELDAREELMGQTLIVAPADGPRTWLTIQDCILTESGGYAWRSVIIQKYKQKLFKKLLPLIKLCAKQATYSNSVYAFLPTETVMSMYHEVIKGGERSTS